MLQITNTVRYCDLMEAGVIDPAKVTTNAVENSASVAGLVLTQSVWLLKFQWKRRKRIRHRRFDAEGWV